MDTLALHRRLVDAGAEPKLAEAITSGISDAIDAKAASKADLREAVTQLRADMDKLLLRIGLMFAGGLTLMFLAMEYASR